MLFDTVEFLSENSTIVNPVVSGEMKQSETAPTSSASTVSRQYVDDVKAEIQTTLNSKADATQLASVETELADKADASQLTAVQTALNAKASLDQAQTFTEIQSFEGLIAQGPVIETVISSDSTSQFTIDLADGPIIDLTLTQNCELIFPTYEAGKQFTLVLTQDATGNRTATFPASVVFNSTFTITSTANHTDVISFIALRGKWVAFVSGLNYNLV